MLSDSDREWLEDKFNRVHERIDSVESRSKSKESDVHKIQVDMATLKAAGCPSVLSHEEKHHNPAKTWGIVAAMVGALTGMLEIGKWLFKTKNGGGQ